MRCGRSFDGGFRIDYRMAFLVLIVLAAPATAQEHRVHPAGDIPLHEKFYSSLHMPDHPTKSCCNKADCYPTEVRVQGGMIFARRREDGKWLLIPSNKVERHRDNPDGRNHIARAAASTQCIERARIRVLLCTWGRDMTLFLFLRRPRDLPARRGRDWPALERQRLRSPFMSAIGGDERTRCAQREFGRCLTLERTLRVTPLEAVKQSEN